MSSSKKKKPMKTMKPPAAKKAAIKKRHHRPEVERFFDLEAAESEDGDEEYEQPENSSDRDFVVSGRIRNTRRNTGGMGLSLWSEHCLSLM